MPFTTIIHSILFQPSKLFSLILKEKRPAVYIFPGLGLIVGYIFVKKIGDIIAYSESKTAGIISISIGLIPSFLGFLSILLIVTSIWYFAYLIFSSEEERQKTLPKQKKFPLLFLILLSISFFPAIFLPSAAIFCKLFNPTVSQVLYSLFKLFILGWIAVLQLKSIRAFFNVSKGKAFLIYISPFLLLLLVSLMLTISFITALFNLVMNLASPMS